MNQPGVLDKYVKAIVGGILSALMSLQTGMLDNKLEPVEWIGVAIAFFVVIAGIWGVGEVNDRMELKKQDLAFRAAQLSASLPTPPEVVITDKVVQVQTDTPFDDNPKARHTAPPIIRPVEPSTRLGDPVE